MLRSSQATPTSQPKRKDLIIMNKGNIFCQFMDISLPEDHAEKTKEKVKTGTIPKSSAR